jgi:hypothetical protein
MQRPPKTTHVTLRTDAADTAHLTALADAARAKGKPFVQRSAIIRAALAYAAAEISTFSITYL